MSRKIRLVRSYNQDMTSISFYDRLGFLRNERNISAREMSLALGQNESYINKIEPGQRSLPMESFLRICDYLQISPATLFDDKIRNMDIETSSLVDAFRKLSPRQTESIFIIMTDLVQ